MVWNYILWAVSAGLLVYVYYLIALEVIREYPEPIDWMSFRKVCLAVQFVGAALYLYLSFRIPPPGLAIAILGLMAGVMAFRAEAKENEKVCWVAVIFCLMILEMVAIGREHQRQNETAETIIRQGVRTLEGINNLQHVLPKELSGAAAPPPRLTVVKPRSFLDIGPEEVGIDSERNLFVNIYCVNVGPDLIRLLDCGAMVFIHDNTTVGSVNFAVDKVQQEKYFERFLNEKQSVSPRSLIPENYIWFSPPGPLATPQLIEDLNNNKKTLVVVGQALYKDDHTIHKNDLCEWMQPPVTPKPVWVPCLVHKGEPLGSH